MTKTVAVPDITAVFLDQPASHIVHKGPLGALAEFYRDPLARVTLLVTSLLLCYVGGAAMFYVHAILFNEGGPAISPYLHWALDSSFGFIALTPIIAVLLPLAVWLIRDRPRWLFPLVLGVLFAVITIPGPLAHDMFVARGTPIAAFVTHHWGDPSIIMQPPTEYTAVAKMTHQFLGGLPVYLALSTVAYVSIRAIVAKWHKSS
ncbi:hypothetical protein LWC34_34280 [Kibdelosporangium philippinense]|uniref:Uncharacterized protein n=1 Tax=Kibdelosporangium philippinense TaxID=211113 RepID=A0ABS8ZK41_9PSEU|nr:hypothetical protein [Kibdelosporangium philippinense]MCE7007852.1 hypothetical protein [Kibdelosporangium philippinense]